MNITAQSPGKIILSGEHAVVYGQPAIVAAVARYTTVQFHPLSRGNSLRTALAGIATGRRTPLSALQSLRDKLDARFEAFAKGDLAVKNILQRPDDLMLYTLAQIAGHFLPTRDGEGRLRAGQLHTRSDLPLGAGMGSSAAIIAATMVLYEHLLNQPQSLAERFARIRFCERLQHGKGSAIDAAAVTYGGVQLLANQEPQPLDVSLKDCYWLLTGIPQSSTGECVAAVREQFGKDKALWQAFGACSAALQTGLQHQDTQAITAAIDDNQSLLHRIGIVPPTSQAIIAAIKNSGGAAKISGAGSIRGDAGGMLLIYHQDEAALRTLLEKDYPQLSWGRLQVAAEGAAIVSPHS